MLKKSPLYLFGLLSLCIITSLSAFSIADDDGFNAAKQEIMLRKIGHQILLQSGDRTSRVLPIKIVADNEYQITFEKEFTFKPDSLVSIVKNALAQHKPTQDYVINVLNCRNNEVIFGYAVLESAKDDIIACSGRVQPKSCYIINLKFRESGISPIQKGYLVGGLPLLAFVGLLFFKNTGRKTPIVALTAIKLGETFFDPSKKSLLILGQSISLTAKENRLLLIFAESPNVIIERSRLQKELWEDEGVIVGRSLDVFISRIRKKLESDPTLKVTNIHNKGYRLEITKNS